MDLLPVASGVVPDKRKCKVTGGSEKGGGEDGSIRAVCW